MKLKVIALTLVVIASGCTTSGRAVAVHRASPDCEKQLLGRVRDLAGTWEARDESGKTVVASVFTVTSSGSAVREVMLPNSDHEMTNLYHMDGESLLLTHYCAVGNQPRMRAVRSETKDILAFNFDSVTNLGALGDHYMGQMRLVFVDSDHIRQEWYSFTNGTLGKPTIFELSRRK